MIATDFVTYLMHYVLARGIYDSFGKGTSKVYIFWGVVLLLIVWRLVRYSRKRIF